MKKTTKLTKEEILTINNALRITESRYIKQRNDCIIVNVDTSWYDKALNEIEEVDKKLQRIFFEL